MARTTAPLISCTSALRPFIQSWSTVVRVVGDENFCSTMSSSAGAYVSASVTSASVSPKTGRSLLPDATVAAAASRQQRSMNSRTPGTRRGVGQREVEDRGGHQLARVGDQLHPLR